MCVCVCVCACIFLEFVHVVLCVCGVCVYIHNQVCVSFTRTQMYTEWGSQIRVKYHFLWDLLPPQFFPNRRPPPPRGLTYYNIVTCIPRRYIHTHIHTLAEGPPDPFKLLQPFLMTPTHPHTHCIKETDTHTHTHTHTHQHTASHTHTHPLALTTSM